MNSIKQTILTIIICLAVVAGVSLVYSYTQPPYLGVCDNPPCPPGGNTPEPINIGPVSQTKSGALQVNGFRNLGNALFDNNVSIGTTDLNYKFSVLGNVGLLRLPGQNITPGRGPSISLQSPSNSTSPQTSSWTQCGCSETGQLACPSDNCDGNIDFDYVCPAGSGGTSCIDVIKLGTCTPTTSNPQRVYLNVKCVANTDVYNLRTNAGTLEFTNTAGVTTLTLGQDGKVGIGKVPAQTLDVNGSVGAAAFLYSSDYNLKKNIQSLSSQLEKVLTLQGVSFNWKTDDKKDIGLVAQDAEKIFPEVVYTNQETGLKSIDYAKLIVPLIESVKEQQKQINELKTICK